MGRMVAAGVAFVTLDGAGIGCNPDEVQPAETTGRDRTGGSRRFMHMKGAANRLQILLEAARIGALQFQCGF